AFTGGIPHLLPSSSMHLQGGGGRLFFAAGCGAPKEERENRKEKELFNRRCFVLYQFAQYEKINHPREINNNTGPSGLRTFATRLTNEKTRHESHSGILPVDSN
ncbi:unnamed protein product, partial [Ectocarpus sp. 4 AP-2014]